MLKIKLSRDLRKSILQGHPWIYREALDLGRAGSQACLAQLLDKKAKPLAWGLYSPNNPLAFRVISLEKKPPNLSFFKNRIKQAFEDRASWLNPDTNSYRLINGEGDGLPGLVCDVYNNTAVVQFDGKDCFDFWNQDWLLPFLQGDFGFETVYVKERGTSKHYDSQLVGSERDLSRVGILENQMKFLVDVKEGQKTGFFLDQRNNRHYVRSQVKDKSFLNLFSYTGGFSIAAGLGGATQVTSVDIAPKAIDRCQENWIENSLEPEKHQGVSADVFEWIEKQSSQWEAIVVDPPSMTHSEKTKAVAMESYTDLFSRALRLLKPNGHLFLSSCSSHISFGDFFEIIDGACSKARVQSKILRVSGQGPDHPFPHCAHELRYLKFVHLKVI